MLTEYENKGGTGWRVVTLAHEEPVRIEMRFARQTTTADVARCCLEHWGKGVLEEEDGKLTWVK